MDKADRAGIEDAFATANAHTSALAMAFFGLLNELADRQVLDATAVENVERFTIAALHRAGAEIDATAKLEELYRQRFQEARDNCRS